MNLSPLLSKLSIVDTRAHLIPFTLNWAQQEYLAEVHRQYTETQRVRIIVLKARQLGISTVTEAIMFLWCFIFTRVSGLVIAHEASSSQHLLGMTQTYWDTYPFRSLYTTKYKSRNELSWIETGSSLKVATAKSVDTGRSKTLQMLHASEIGMWEKAVETIGGLSNAFHNEPGTFGCMESTARGVGGFFYDYWNAAVDGEIDYKPLFFPWWRHPQYTWSHMTGATTLPVLSHLDEEERVLVRMGVDEDHLLWRRWSIRNDHNNDLAWFHQEMPSTPEEAFVATGYNVFPLHELQACYEPIEHPVIGRLIRQGEKVIFQADISGPLKIYVYPSKDTDWGKYMVAGDPTRGDRTSNTGDFAVGQVINRRNYEQVAVWRGKIDGASFGEELAKLGMYYNQALLTCETTGAGYTTIGSLITMNYPHLYKHRYADKEPTVIATQYGWDTNQQRKEWMIGFLRKVMFDRVLTIHDQQTFHEMRNYVTLPGSGFGPNSSSGFDDCVTSLAMACVCSSTEVLMAYEGPLKREDDTVETWQAWNEEPA